MKSLLSNPTPLPSQPWQREGCGNDAVLLWPDEFSLLKSGSCVTSGGSMFGAWKHQLVSLVLLPLLIIGI